MCFSFLGAAQADDNPLTMDNPNVNLPMPEVSDPRIFNPASGVTPIAGKQETVLGFFLYPYFFVVLPQSRFL